MESAPSEYLEPEPRHWPLVIGILGLLWGGAGAVTSIMALAGVGREAQPPILRGSLGHALSAIAAVLALMLAIGSVQLLRRRASGVQLIRAWAPLAALMQGLLLVIMISHQEAFERSFREEFERQARIRAEQAGQAEPRLPEGAGRFLYVSGVGCGGFSAVVPTGIAAIFVFGRRGREAIAEWSAGAAA
jgi:hypothetical protein